MDVIKYSYQPQSIKPGILHIGVGNFHRAHQQYYINKLLADPDQHAWGISGVCLLPSDQTIVERLRSQDLKYTLSVYGRDGRNEVYEIASLRELLWSLEQPDRIIERISDPDIKIITLTITEGGYNIDKATNEFMLDDAKIKQDLIETHEPKTVFGFIAKGLRKRKADDAGGITILSCDNLQHNGNTAKKAFLSFIKAQDEELARWVETNVSFPNSMVDRITPATTAEDVLRLNEASGVEDKAPVYCEDFIQWVIEENFIAGRPALERVGVEFTNDVSAYENMKLSLLNASHTLLSYPSFLMGYRKVDKAVGDEQINRFVKVFMENDVTPYVPAPPNTDLALYKKTLLERFANRSVSDQLGRLCFDGISKFPVYIMPNLARMLTDGKDVKRLAFLLASYRHYLKYKTDDMGQSFEVAEPAANAEDEHLINSDDTLRFLELSAFKSIRLNEHENFVALYQNFVQAIKTDGASKTLASILK